MNLRHFGYYHGDALAVEDGYEGPDYPLRRDGMVSGGATIHIRAPHPGTPSLVDAISLGESGTECRVVVSGVQIDAASAGV